jgi:hypothetical protein
MIQSDYYSDVNPALCSLILCNFASKYQKASNIGPSYPLMVVPIPLVLSGELDNFFAHKQERSDFFALLNQHPEVRVSLCDRIRNSLEITQNALAFSFQNEVLSFDSESKNFIVTKQAQQIISNKFNPIITKYIKKSALLGGWLGRINSDSTIYTHLGIHI